MTYFKEIQIGNFVLRFLPSDNGWMCGITQEMMEALENQQKPEREWVDLTDDEKDEIWGECLGIWDVLENTQKKLKEKNT